MLIDEYFKDIESKITATPYVHFYQLIKDKRSLHIGFISGFIRFISGTELHFMEFVDLKDGVDRYKYSYHYQDETGKAVFRYDMAPHFSHILTTPHHKRVFLEPDEIVIASQLPTLEEVLQEISGAITETSSIG